MLKFGSPTIIRSLFINFVKPPQVPAINKQKLDFLTQTVRYTGFYNRLTGSQLWKGVTSVSNAGKRKGRGRGNDKRVRNLNIGQKVGKGRLRVVWPGLNSPVIKNREVQRIRESTEKVEEVAAPQPPIRVKKTSRVHPLERGWSGRQQRGRKIGPPLPLEDETFEGFESIILHNQLTSKLTSVLGRKRTYSSIVATGNGNGLIGVGRAKSLDSRVAINLARKKASKRLVTIDLIENHTVNHDFFSEYGRTRITVLRMPEGYGLRCHRIIKALCELVGIRNMYAKVEGAMNTIHIIRAFIIGLLRQKTYQEIAEENKLHLVEFRSDTMGFPRVLASPETCLSPKEAREKSVLFEEYIMGGRLRYIPDKKIPFYMKLPSWTIHLKRTQFCRNHEQVKMDLINEYGAIESHLTKKYPECIHGVPKKKKESGEV